MTTAEHKREYFSLDESLEDSNKDVAKLAAAMSRADQAEIDRLLEHINLVRMNERNKGRLLFEAIRYCSLSMVQRLLQVGADPHFTAKGCSAVEAAVLACYGDENTSQIGIVDALLAAADLPEDFPALWVAVRNRSLLLVKKFLAAGYDHTFMKNGKETALNLAL